MRPPRVSFKKMALPLALCATALLAANGAQARDVDVQWSVTIGVPGVVVRSGPVYGGPVYGGPVYGGPVYGGPVYGGPVYGGPVYGGPVYGAPVYGPPVVALPAPVYAPAPVVVMPAPVLGPPRHRHRGYVDARAWDRDGDGIPNRFDPVYNPRWDRDGDGIPNRYDRYDNRRDGWRR